MGSKTQNKIFVALAVFATTGFALLLVTRATNSGDLGIEAESAVKSGAISSQFDETASGGQFAQFGSTSNALYAANLQLIQAQSVRNRNHDNSLFRDTPQDQLPINTGGGLVDTNRAAYLNNPNGNPEQAFPVANGGQFRTSCEFSHFAYDDPLVFPNEPGRAHLHMFFGNTDVNAYSTYDTLANSGSSTCNGQELNRTGYWAPAMIDNNGNARIPERIVVYYKGEGLVRGRANVYKPGMAKIAPNPTTVAETQWANGGALGEVNFKCSNNFSGGTSAVGVENIPNCPGMSNGYPGFRTVLEMEVKFFNCFDRNAADDDLNGWRGGAGNWFGGNCDPVNADHYPHLSYFINYVVEPGDNAANWFLSSDVNPASLGGNATLSGAPGSSHHADWWGGWHPDINQEWIDNCTNYINPSGAASGCSMGFLSDGGPNGANPFPGRALKYRPQYDTPGNSASYKASLPTIFSELCVPNNPSHSYTNPASGGLCLTQ